MTPSEIAKEARLIKTPGDLLSLINRIKLLKNRSYVTNNYNNHLEFKIFTLVGLAYYCNPNTTKVNRYKTFYIKKKSGGVRTISAPLPMLKAILRPINDILSSLYEPQPCVMGFTQCRSVVDNAKAHLGQNYILNLDLKDFFPSISQARVWKRLQLPPFSFNQTIAGIIAGLCCIKIKGENEEIHNVLPQGAPTSPILTNIVCEKLDRKLSGVAKRFNLRYTRYADDITFSCMHNALKSDGDAFKEICNVIKSQGFTINEQKTRLQKKGAKQEVTGLILSNKVNVTRSYVRALDQLLYVWEKFGYDKALARLYYERQLKEYQKKSLPTLEEVIKGKLEYLKMVKGKNDRVYLKYHAIYSALCNKHKNSDQNNSLEYIATYTFNDFINLYNAEITTDNTNDNRMSKLKLGNIVYDLRITNQAIDLLRKNNYHNSANDHLFISFCRDHSTHFWLCHKHFPKKDSIKLTIPAKTLINIWVHKGIDAAIHAQKKANENELLSYILNKTITQKPKS